MAGEQRRLKLQQTLTFGVLFFGYATYIFDRKSFATNIPNIKRVENISGQSIGSVVSSLAVGYAIGKFAGGILVDSFSPKHLFAAGLVLCGSLNLAFSTVSSPAVFAALWFANGLFQGFGWPSCAKLIRSWYSPTVFGTLWSLLSASMNVAASISPFLVNTLTDNYGSWRYSLQAYGMLSLFASALAFLFIYDTPKDCGFSTNNIARLSGADGSEVNNTDAPKKNGTTEKTRKPSFKSSILRIITSPFLYVMACGFLAILFCKGVISDFGPSYLIEKKNATRTMTSVFTGTVEIGGIIGSIFSGIMTDWIISRSSQEKGHPRNLFVIPCLAVLVTCMMALRTYISDVPKQYMETVILGFVIGFTLYGLISIVGVMTIERSAKDLSGTGHAVAALFGNVGLAMSGLPFTMIIEAYSWDTGFIVVECCLVFWAIVASLSQFMVCRIGDVKRKRE